MALAQLKTIPTSVSFASMPSTGTFSVDVCDWAGTSLVKEGPITADYGVTGTLPSNTSSMTIEDIRTNSEGGFLGSSATGFTITRNIGGAQECNISIKEEGSVGQRWMPASIFNGLYVLYNLGDKNSSPYCKKIALKYLNSSGSYRIFAFNTPSTGNHGSGTKTFKVNPDDGSVGTIRSWGSDWKLDSVIFHCRLEDGANSRDLDLLSIGIAHKYSTDNPGYRVIPQGRRLRQYRSATDNALLQNARINN